MVRICFIFTMFTCKVSHILRLFQLIVSTLTLRYEFISVSDIFLGRIRKAEMSVDVSALLLFSLRGLVFDCSLSRDNL